MKNFKKLDVVEIQAVQYGTDEEAQQYVELCKTSYDGETRALPKDLLGTPKDAFRAVKTTSGFVRIQPSDWIVQKDNELLSFPMVFSSVCLKKLIELHNEQKVN